LIFTFIGYGYDSIEILNKNILIHKSGYLISDKELTPNEAITKDNLIELPKKAIKLAFNKNSYWFLFDISVNNSDEKFYMDIKNPYAKYCDLYTFDNGRVVKIQKSGYAMEINNRSLETLPVRFELWDWSLYSQKYRRG